MSALREMSGAILTLARAIATTIAIAVLLLPTLPLARAHDSPIHEGAARVCEAAARVYKDAARAAIFHCAAPFAAITAFAPAVAAPLPSPLLSLWLSLFTITVFLVVVAVVIIVKGWLLCQKMRPLLSLLSSMSSSSAAAVGGDLNHVTLVQCINASVCRQRLPRAR